MKVLNLLHANESYTHDNWVYTDVNVSFSRLYYVLDGEAYYVENDKRHRLKKNHLYLTPVKKPFSLYNNPNDKMLHTFSHVVTAPAVTEFMEIEVKKNTLLEDATQLYRKYVKSDAKTLVPVIQFLLSCIDVSSSQSNPIAEKIRDYIDALPSYVFNMDMLSKDLGYTREYLTRTFSDEYHLSPKQYFISKRINKGLDGLLSGKSVKEVADLLSYSTPFAFSKAFKQHFGLSPENYLKSICPLQTVCPK